MNVKKMIISFLGLFYRGKKIEHTAIAQTGKYPDGKQKKRVAAGDKNIAFKVQDGKTPVTVDDFLKKIISEMDGREKAIQELFKRKLVGSFDRAKGIMPFLSEIIENLNPSPNNWNAIFISLCTFKEYINYSDPYGCLKKDFKYLKNKADIYLDEVFFESLFRQTIWFIKKAQKNYCKENSYKEIENIT
jgi:hypothetical protein